MAHDGGERGAGSLLSRMQHGLFVLLTGIGLARALTTGAALAPVLLGVTLLLGWYAAGLALPHAPGTFPWATFLVNVSGSLAMGLLVAWLVTHPGAHHLARPFVGVGVLGG